MSSTKWIPRSIRAKIKATHFNDFINRNALNYTVKAVNDGASSWVKPFLKPQLVGHDKQKDPIGRITDYRIARSETAEEPTDYIELTATINDSASIEKVLDGRFNTVSVGSRSARVLCSECNQNIIEDGLCEHKKGTFNSKGNRIHWKIDQIDYVECSFVNEPADDYAGIDQIDIGFGFVPYKDFLDNQESLLTEATNAEVNKMNDAVLSATTRNKLSDSSFCYVAGSGDNKVRKFPAHDAAHVRNGLARLSQATLSDKLKGKILACLKRRAKRFGVQVTKDEVFTEDMVTYINSLDPLFKIHEDFSEAEQVEVNEFFNANPEIDQLPEPKTEPAQTDQVTTEIDPEKMKKDELLVAFKTLQEKSKTDLETADSKITTLEKQLADNGTILSSREDEVNRYIDQLASTEKKLRDAIINNILDLKKSDTTEDRATATTKLESRQLQSLVDTLADLRIEIITTTDNTVENKDQVIDPTQVAAGGNQTPAAPVSTKKDPWSIFGQDNRLAEV